MNDKQIECFLQTAKHLSFTKAAQNLYLPQPAVSRYISALEEELGVDLFIRENSRHISLSDEGTLYFNFFQRYFAELHNIRKMLANTTNHIRLGYNIGWNVSSFLPKVVNECRSEDPDFMISFECLGFRDLLQALEDKHLDAIITSSDYVEGRADLVRYKFTSIPRIVVYSELLPDFDKIKTAADFASYTFYMIDDPRVGELCQDIELLFRPYGFVPRFTAVPNINTVFASVENGLGVAVLDGWYQGIHHPGIHYFNLNDHLPISIAWKRNTISSSIDMLYKKINEHFKSID
ncbi:LysR family transcriptional regulator [Pseudobutyrivibrio ruminis]|uniref:LysR family transcriptional regulator n=1 Tax=Pseudobutyrivibrio ruminis TaxID=46206 RepID=UPI00051BF208|nr:LysR family transcriptional regulator [Pseudobutyrivibrio ruminis]